MTDVSRLTSSAYSQALEVIASVEPRIAEATRAELADQRASLKLIASENYASPAVLMTMGTWFSDKYAEGTVGHRFYAGCQNVDTVESLAAEHARELFGAEYAYVQPHSGIDANLVAFWSILAHRVEGPWLEKAGSTEFDPETPEPVIATMAEQKEFVEGAGDLGGTMRLGMYPAHLKAGSIVREVYGDEVVSERHRHRYEVNNAYRPRLEEAGLVFSGTSPDDTLVEYVELPREVHPYYVATQAHPELRSRPTRPHPLFKGLVGAAIARQRELRFPIDEKGLRREPADDE